MITTFQFDSATYKLDETSELSKELRTWEASNYPILQSPKWQELTAALRGTEVFGKVYAASENNSKILRDFNLLTSTLNSARPVLSDLELALTNLKTEMGEELTAADLQFVNQALVDNYFLIIL